ncbi:hypothetical protein PZ897_18005 [Hoeflea sp. YIM 152468]|uniref:hypothetical protein n=1 Tax=Hoeflea sp. YIM 152468 TaxID=3031759 RepID=UPI0023DA8DD3|nr:hypothetical protein [Hoeflea sp. YIM 152468]MDF1610079.1 hypothetical protein [Hoeflea sp. YIM 152468]
MVEYTPSNRPGEPGRPHEHVRESTVVKSGSSTGALVALVLVVLLAIIGFVFWSAGDDQAVNTTTPGAEINEQVAPDAAIEPARPVPAPDAPAIPEAADPAAPAAPLETAPAPATDG